MTKEICTIIELHPQRSFLNKQGQTIKVQPMTLQSGNDLYHAEVFGLDVDNLPQGLGGGDLIWVTLQFSVREYEKNDSKYYAQQVVASGIVRFNNTSQF